MSNWALPALIAAIVVILLLAVKVIMLKKSAREIGEAFVRKTENPTNTLIHISSHDKDMMELASAINTQLQVFHRGRQRFEQGDLELKEAITNISHDLRTPLTAICGYLKLLKKEEAVMTERACRHLAAIENRTLAMKQLTEELFAYTMAASEKEELVLTPLSLNGVMEEAISSYYAVLTERGITPEIMMPEERIERNLNEYALSRIFGNIISNAVKYSDGDLAISLEPDGTAAFSNHAAALTETQVGRLFDRFYTVSDARKSTGLGLSIAKTLTEKMGGDISAEYEAGILTIKVSF